MTKVGGLGDMRADECLSLLLDGGVPEHSGVFLLCVPRACG